MCKSFVITANPRKTAIFLLSALAVLPLAPQQPHPLDLPTSKQLFLPAPGAPQRLNSLPISLALSPDHRWLVSLNAGYGTFESSYAQSLAVLDTTTGAVRDFPDARLGQHALQTFFSGLVFSADGTHLYASVGSTTDPSGTSGGLGNGVAVYAFHDGALTPETFLQLPRVALPHGRYTDDNSHDTAPDAPHHAAAFPAGIALVPGAHPRLLITEDLADAAVLIDAATGTVERSFDLSAADAVPSTYPDDVVVTRDGTRAFVSLWNASQVVELNLVTGTITARVNLLKPASPTAPGSHPCALLLDEHSSTLYVALANRDAVAALAIGRTQLTVRGYFDTRLPGQSYFGAEPNALALNADASRLYAANMASDAVAVLDPRRIRSMQKARGMVEPLGFVPTELMPTALASTGGRLYIATDKGKGTGPNNRPQRVVPGDASRPHGDRTYTYSPTLLYGSLASLDTAAIDRDLQPSTAVVLESNRMKAEAEALPFAAGKATSPGISPGISPIKHIIYIIRENRTYDQVLGDLAVDGHPVANGDPSLTLYGQAITPNAHKLALQFGVLDNFYDSAEVSGDGHVWSNAAIGTDYLERTWQQNYRSSQRTYDYEGMVADGYPILQHIPDVEEPATGYIWGDMASHGRSVYNFGEYVSSLFCGERTSATVIDPKAGPMAGQRPCASDAIAPGQPLPADWGTGNNLWPWPIPRLAKNIPTKPELVGHYAADYPDFNLRIPDQVRATVFLHHLAAWQHDRAAGHDSMPAFIELHLGNDHTAGTTPGGPTPASSVADNDLAIGRLVEAVSHSPYWQDTAFFILEDDAQNGADHVDAHRSPVLIVSRFAPHPAAGQPAFIDSRFYSTVSVLRTMEALAGVPPMNNNDALASLIGSLFTGPGDQPPYTADASNRDNGLLYTANKKDAPGAAESQKMDFSHPDRADSSRLNFILWHDARPTQPAPAMLSEKHPKKKDDDD